jgi:acyl transferase domain-containing protein/NADPH:quinone reductase-like Zn-dependent oxidoreductase/acyl carrier protein
LRQADVRTQTTLPAEPTAQYPTLPFVLSAATPEALQASAQALLDVTKDTTSALDASRYYSLAHHLAHRREHLTQRAVFFCDAPHALQTQLQSLAAGSGVVKPGEALAQPKGPVFIFAGNGAQWSGMGCALLEHPIFKKALAEVDALFQPLSGVSLAEQLPAALGDDNLYAHTDLAQPALFAVQVGIVRVLESLGVTPQAVAGHSVGEVAAAWAAGRLDLPAAVQVIFHRSRLQETTKGLGKMTAVALDAEAVQALLTKHSLEHAVFIAGENSQRGVTLAATESSLAIVEELLAAQRIGYKRLELDYAFHSPVMDQIKAPLLDALAAMPSVPSLSPSERLPFYSVVTGRRLEDSAPTPSTLDAHYWWDNIRKPVLFKSAMASALQDGFNIFIEIGPHPILQNYLRDAVEGYTKQNHQGSAADIAVIMPTLTRQSPDVSALQHTAARYAVAGGKLDWRKHFSEQPHHSLQALQLPNYPWQKERHWHGITAEAPDTLNRQTLHPLLGYQLKNHDWTWEQKLDPVSCSYLADHVVGGGTVLPGTAFAEIALAAAKQWQAATSDSASADGILRLVDLDILSPVVFGSADHPERYQTRVLRTHLDSSDGSLRILSRELLSNEAWVLNAKCRIIAQARMNPSAPALPVPLRSPDFDRHSQLELTKQVGLHYGPSFALIDRGWILESDGHPCALARFEPTLLGAGKLATQGAPAHLLHPAVLDCSFQLIIQLLKEQIDLSQGIAFVPTQIGSCWFDGQASTPAVVQVKLLRRLPHSLLVDFTLFDDEGRVVCEITGARFKRVRLQKAAQRPIVTLVEQRVAAPKYPELIAARIDDKAVRNATVQLNQRLAQDPIQRAFAQELDPLLDVLSEVASQATPDDGVSARDIWNTLLRDYPDFSHTIRLVGRHGSSNDVPAAYSAEWLGTAGLGQLLSIVSATTDAPDLTVLVAGAQCSKLATHVGRTLSSPARAHNAALVYALAASDDPLQAKSFTEACPHAYVTRAALSSDTTDLDARFVAPTDFQADLVIYWANFSNREEQDQALQYAFTHSKPGACFLLIGQHPSQWMNAAFGWEADQVRTRSGWIATLASIGLEQLSPAMPLDTMEVGPYLLFGHKPLATATLTERLTAPRHTTDAPKSWVLVVDESQAQTRLAERLSLALQQRGDIASVCVKSPLNPFEDTAAAALLESRSNFGVLDGIMFLSGTNNNAPESTTESLENNCLALTALLKACDATQTSAPIWVITAHSDRVSLPGATLVVAPLEPATLYSAALTGFARSLGNETSAGRIRLIDLVSETNKAVFESELLIHALADECCHPTAGNEVVLTHTGERFTSRVRVDIPPATVAESYGLRFSQPGQLRNLQWEPIELTALAPDAIEVSVQATGLNFRDVMYTLGLLSDEALEQGFAGPTLGLEFAGVVTQTGQAVTHLAVGDRVVGFGGACFANRLITPASAAARIPRGFSVKAAATIPSAFLTSYYALHHLAKLAPGERVLIHGAAGGVGLAAIQIARWCGAEIFATAGSDEKRDFLRLLGVHHVLDSRTLRFADDILELTQGQGVDVVLNSLSGEAIARNLSILKPFGRFLELGKRDFYENTRIGLRPFRLNISYFGIDADQLLSQCPDLTRRLFTEVMDLFEEGVLAPLPYTRFDASEVIDAFRFMQQSKQIGKVVVTYNLGAPVLAQSNSEVRPTASKPLSSQHLNTATHLTLHADASYLVTGGARGFGLRTAKWLVEKGARNVVLLSRSATDTTDLESLALLQKMQDSGASITTLACDVTDLTRLKTCVEGLVHPVKGVIHAAAVIEDSLAVNLNASLLHKVLAPKILGALNLHTLSAQWDLDFFVMYSSATTFFGNPGQAAYVAANSWLEALASARHEQGLTATCMRWGAIEDAGFLARHQHIKEALEQRMGGQALHSDVALEYLERAILSGQPNIGVLELEWNALRKFLPNASGSRFLDLARRAIDTTHSTEQATDVLSMVQTLTDKELRDAFGRMIQDELAQILRLDPDKIPLSKSVYDLGLDSLMGVELITALEARFGVRLPVMAISEDSTIDRLALRLIGLLKSDQGSDQGPDRGADAAMDNTIEAIAAVAAQHATDTSQKEIEALAQSLNDPARQQSGSLLS